MKKLFVCIFMVMSFTGIIAQNMSETNNVVFGKKHFFNPVNVRKIASNELLTTVPNGNSNIYYRTGRAFYDDGFNTILTRSDGGANCIVFTPDNKVYIQNPISRFIDDTWIEGNLENDIVTIKTPQLIAILDDYGVEKRCYVKRMKLNEEGNHYIVDSLCTDIQLKLQTDGSLKQLDNQTLLGVVDEEDHWMFYGDNEMQFELVKEKKITLPQSAIPEKWKLLWNGYNEVDVSVAIDGNNVYVNGFSTALPDSYVKGTIIGDKVVFDKGQYLGADTLISEYHVYLAMGSVDSVYDENIFQMVEKINLMETLTFSYNADKKVMKADSLLLLMGGKEDRLIIDRIDAPWLKYQKELVEPCKPLDPIIFKFEEYEQSNGYGMFQFDLPREDVEGNIIPADSITYCIYIDDELFTFMRDEYLMIPEEMTEVPYDYDDQFDFFTDGIRHTVFFYAQGFEKMGVQTVITINGKKTYSNIMYNNGSVTTTAIGNVENENSSVKSVEYYDLNGRRLTKPIEGVLIKKVIYNNGAVKTSKVIK